MGQLSILLVEDQADDAISIQRLLRDENIGEWEVASSARDALKHVREHGPFDVHIFDLHLPDASDLQLLEKLSRAGFSAWDRSIVVTGVADSDQQGQAISAYGMPVVEKERLINSLTPWVRGIVKRPPESLMATVLAAIGAAAWGNGLCGFARVEKTTANQLRQILPDAVVIDVNRQASFVIAPQQGLRDIRSMAKRMHDLLPGGAAVQTLVVTDINRTLDLKALAGRAVDALLAGEFQDAIWPQA